MASYWKSQPRKFCIYCKCWLTDNKPSVEFHEKGKRHQENVKLKIDELKKKSLDDAQKKEEMDDDIQKMEMAALEAFKKDLLENPALAAKYKVKLPEKEKKEEPPSFGPDLPSESERLKYQWYEAVSSEGYHYYWNTKTKESVWEKPANYMSLAEQGLNEDGSEADVEDSPKSTNEDDNADKTSEYLSKNEDNSSCNTDDKLRDEKSPYGAWVTVKHTPLPNLELPIEPVPVEEIPLPATETLEKEEEKPRFKEKRVQSLGSNPGELVAFKKRKLGSRCRNTRQREDD